MRELAAEMAERRNKDSLEDEGETPHKESVVESSIPNGTNRCSTPDSTHKACRSRGTLKPRNIPAPLPPTPKTPPTSQGGVEGTATAGKKPLLPPPVSTKPLKQDNIGVDEPDTAMPTDEMEEANRVQDLVGLEDSITNALREQAKNR